MELSFKIADFLEDMDIEYNVFPSDEGTEIEFKYDENYYILVINDEKISINGESPITYKDFISNIF